MGYPTNTQKRHGYRLLERNRAIILVKGHLPEEDTLEESNNENIPILSSPLQTFEITGQLYKLLHP